MPPQTLEVLSPPPFFPSSITLEQFGSVLSRYDDVIARKSAGYASAARNLDELEQWRDDVLPGLVSARGEKAKVNNKETKEVEVRGEEKDTKGKKQDVKGSKAEASKKKTPEKKKGAFAMNGSAAGKASEPLLEGPHLTKQEVVDLMYCKLKRGKFRPLASLIASNSESKVTKSTTRSFITLTATTPPTRDNVLASLKIAASLSGVGPATASYLLAAATPEHIPVFSDEGFRWVMWEDPKGRNRGWGRELKYDYKEYGAYLDAAKGVAERLDVEVRLVERVGYVLGREAHEGIMHEHEKGGKRKAEDVEEKEPTTGRGMKRSRKGVDDAGGAAKKVRADTGTADTEDEGDKKDIKKEDTKKTEAPTPTSGRSLRNRTVPEALAKKE